MKRIGGKNNHFNFKYTGTKHGKTGDRIVQQNLNITLGISKMWGHRNCG